MKSVELYNGLNGVQISRNEILDIINLAEKEDQALIYYKLSNMLKTYPDKNLFEIELTENLEFQTPEYWLNGAINTDEYESNEVGLNKSISQNEIIEIINNNIFGAVEKATGKDYKRKWSNAKGQHDNYSGQFLMPLSFVNKKIYSGINFFMLAKFDQFMRLIPFENPYFLTFNQIENLGGKVKKGAKAKPVIFFSPIYRFESKEIKKSFTDKLEFEEFIKKNNKEEYSVFRYFSLRYYNVFNGSDVEGIDFKLDELKRGRIHPDNKERNEIAELIIKNYPKPAPILEHFGNQAFYQPSKDIVVMPPFNSFETSNDYYRTLFHEFSHSTGNQSRLKRVFGQQFGDSNYAFEELVAEMSAIYLSAEAGIIWQSNNNHAEYLKSWKNSLEKRKNGDNKILLKVSLLSKKSAEYILNIDENGNPAYVSQLTGKIPNEVEKTPKKLKKEKPKATNFGKKTKREKKSIYPFSHDEIPYETARRAHYWTSFSPEKRAEQEQQRYFNTLKEVYDKYFKIASEKQMLDKFKSLFEKYHAGMLSRKLDELSAKSRTASTMITGGSNFNVRKNEKALNVHRAKEEELFNFHEKYLGYFNDMLFPEEKPIKSGKSNTLERLKDKLKALEESHEKAVKANAEIRKLKKLNLSFNETITKIEEYLLNNGFTSKEVESITSVSKRHENLNWVGFHTTNSSAEIRRIKQRIELEEKLKKTAEVKGDSEKYHFDGGYIFNDYSENRIKIHFDEKPNEEIRSFLKSSGHNFKWSPFNKVWQRQLTTYYKGFKEKLFEFLGVNLNPEPPKDKKLTKKELEEVNPKPFDTKPKSISIKTAITDVLSLNKYKREKELVATLIYNLFKNNDYDQAEITSDYQSSILGSSSYDSKLYYYLVDEIEITDFGKEFINAVNGRLTSLKNQKHNYSFFDGLKKPEKKEIDIQEPAQKPTNSEKPNNINKNSLAHKLANRQTEFEYFEVSNNDIAEFLGNIEKKERESIVISLTGGQGSMKTRFAFQFMNALAQNYRVGHASIEEHPESKLYFDKVEQYLNETALNNIEAPEIQSMEQLDLLIKNNEVIVIDSFAKMQEIEKGFEVDKDLRKKYNGKLFLVIFQQTTDGKMRGGSKSQFDADVVLFTQKEQDYRNNYVWADKNRYQDKPLDQLKFNIYSGKMVMPQHEQNFEETETVNTHIFSFNVK